MRSSLKHDEMKKYAFPRIYIGLSLPFIWMWLPPLSNCPNTSDLLYFPLFHSIPFQIYFHLSNHVSFSFFVAKMSGLHRPAKREMIFSDVIAVFKYSLWPYEFYSKSCGHWQVCPQSHSTVVTTVVHKMRDGQVLKFKDLPHALGAWQFI